MVKFDPKMADTLDLDSLKVGLVGLSPVVGAFYAEAASVCLQQQDHQPGVEMQVDGDCKHRIGVTWSDPGDSNQQRRAWNDEAVATENGAYGIAALLIDRLTEYTIVERSRKGTGFDFWLGKKGASTLLLQDTARMEVSGVRQASSGTVRSRIRRKLDQMTPTDSTALPGVAVVVEFGSPRTRVKTK